MKLRTHKTTAKRIKISGSGKLMMPSSSAQHLRHNKTSRQLSAAKRYKVVAKANIKRLAKLLPYVK